MTLVRQCLGAKGDSTRPLYALISAGVINVILNLVFVIVFKMGVAGVATATVISNFFSACMILYFLTHEEEMLRLDFRKLRIRWEYLLGIIKIGLPAGLQSMVFLTVKRCDTGGDKQLRFRRYRRKHSGTEF